jgi:protein TonB
MQLTTRLSRNTAIATGVLVSHVLVLWGLQNGLLQRVVKEIIPAEILTEYIEPLATKPAPVERIEMPPSRASAAKESAPVPPLPSAQTSAQMTLPAPLTVPPGASSPLAPSVVVSTPPQTAGNPTTPSSTLAAVASAPPVRASLELPSSDAQYLQNPKPAYPVLSKRLGEQGKVVVRVLIGVDGLAQNSEIQQSSGFDRLDQAALTTVMRWRFVPGKRNGLTEAMWFNVPINFVLE